MKRRRHATVEPVFGVLTQYLGMRKVMAKGIHNANKQFKMAAIAYNLKKYLKFENKKVQPQKGNGLTSFQNALNWLYRLLINEIKNSNYASHLLEHFKEAFTLSPFY